MASSAAGAAPSIQARRIALLDFTMSLPKRLCVFVFAFLLPHQETQFNVINVYFFHIALQNDLRPTRSSLLWTGAAERTRKLGEIGSICAD